MDCHSSGIRSSVLVLVSILIASGCKSKPVTEPPDPVKLAQDAKCMEVAKKLENCAFHKEVFMNMTVAAAPTNDKKDKRNPNVMSGQCEVLVLNPANPEAAPDIRPCGDVRMTVANPAILGENGARTIRLDSKGGLVGGLPKGLYNVTAHSDLYKTTAVIQEIPSGSLVKVQFQMPVKIP